MLQLEYVPAKNIVTRTKNGYWFGSDYNMNIYRGCCHGCIYCDSRSDCYHIDDFDTVKAKENALEIIRNDLRRKVKTGVISTGAMSDPYNPFEKEYELTRHALELISAYDFGIAIATKSDLITRDVDLYKAIKETAPVICKITITTIDDDLCSKIEPNVCSSSKRFEAVEKLAEAGIFTGLLMMPILPFLEDNSENIMGIVKRAKDCGARFIYPSIGMTTRMNQRDWYYRKLDELFPQQKLSQKYEKQYGNNYVCTSPKAKQLWSEFSNACDNAGILYKMQDIVGAYKLGYANSQIKFF